MMRLDKAELRRMIEGGETTTVEFKVSTPRPTDLAERLCGMANAQGGWFIIGIEDTSLRIVGVRDTRVAIDMLLRAARQIQPPLLLDPPEPEVYTLDNLSLVVAGIPASNGPLYQSSRVCWIRRSTQTFPLSVSEILQLGNDRGLVRWEILSVKKTTMKDLNKDNIKTYIDRYLSRTPYQDRLNEVEDTLISIGCATVIDNGKVIPTNAGLLFFGNNPQRYLPQSEVICMLYHDELGVNGCFERKIFTGTLREIIDGVTVFPSQHIATYADNEPQRLATYPVEVLREAIVNSVVHRDYSRTEENIRVFFYTNRIEVHNPGRLPPEMTTELVSYGKVVPKLRNYTLATLLRNIPGYMECAGSGIRWTLHKMKTMELPMPQYRENGEFVVTFFLKPPSSRSMEYEYALSHTDGKQTTKQGNIPEEKYRLRIAMRYVQEKGSITNHEYRELTGVSLNTASRDLETLVEREALKKIGKTRGRYYKLP